MAGLAPEAQLQQLQHLQQQLVMQTERISKPQQAPQSTPPIDSNLLAQIQMLTNQLLSKTSGGGGTQSAGDGSGKANQPQQKAEPLFNKVFRVFLSKWYPTRSNFFSSFELLLSD